MKHGRVLVIKKRDGGGECLVLSGGELEFGELLMDGLVREMREEVGAGPVEPWLAFVMEYVGANHERAIQDRNVHVLNLICSCADIVPAEGALAGSNPGDDQIAAVWMGVAEVEAVAFYPKGLLRYLDPDCADGGLARRSAIHIGDIN